MYTPVYCWIQSLYICHKDMKTYIHTKICLEFFSLNWKHVKYLTLNKRTKEEWVSWGDCLVSRGLPGQLCDLSSLSQNLRKARWISVEVVSVLAVLHGRCDVETEESLIASGSANLALAVHNK